jgi:hypothetical protein
MTDPPAIPPPALRAAIAADFGPVRRLAPPVVRAAALVPLAVVLLLTAPAIFAVRDASTLGWSWSWGASIAQAVLGLALVAAALRESVPGRSWPRPALVAWFVAAPLSVTIVAVASWSRSPVELTGGVWFIGSICFVAALVSALPATMLAVVLAVRAWPTRPAVAGWLAGLGGGLMADAGWRLFCHFSEPHHVLLTHLGGVLVAGAAGAWLTSRLTRATR